MSATLKRCLLFATAKHDEIDPVYKVTRLKMYDCQLSEQ